MNAEIDIINDEGTTPLHVIARNPEAISIMKRLLLKCDADVHIQDQDGRMQFLIAVLCGNLIDLYKLLFKYDTKLTLFPRIGRTHFIFRVISFSLIAKWLLEQDTSLTTAKDA